MSELNPYEQLGVSENASFEEIQTAKKNLKEQYQNNTQVLESIETAYDAIIMQRLRLRQEGKIKVPEQIRFPEKTVEKKKVIPLPVSQRQINALNKLSNFLDTSTPKETIVNTLIFTVLIFLTVFDSNGENLPLLLTVGVGAGFVILYRKQKLFWRSVGIVFLCFLVAIIGANIVFSLGISAGIIFEFPVEQFASIITFFVLWLVANFIR